MIKANMYPLDIMEAAHTEEDCWCQPVEFKDLIIHRRLDMIERMGYQGKLITGFVCLHYQS